MTLPTYFHLKLVFCARKILISHLSETHKDAVTVGEAFSGDVSLPKAKGKQI